MKTQRSSTISSDGVDVNSKNDLSELLQKLKKEHQIVRKECNLLLSTVKDISRGRTARRIGNAVAMINHLEDLLTAHEAAEEQVLLPIIEKYLDSDVREAIHNEHRQLMTALQNMSTRVAALESREGSNESPAESIEEFGALTRAHFSREENVLFWFVSLRLTEPDSLEITRNLKRLDSPL